MLTALAILCVLVLIAWALMTLYVAAKWCLRLLDEACDGADQTLPDVTTDALPERAPVEPAGGGRGAPLVAANSYSPNPFPDAAYKSSHADLVAELDRRGMPVPEWMRQSEMPRQ